MKYPMIQTARLTGTALILASLFISLTPRMRVVSATTLSDPEPRTALLSASSLDTEITPASLSDENLRARVSESYGKVPMRFEVNQGQTDGRVKYISRGAGYTLFLTATESVFAMRKAVETGGKTGFRRNFLAMRLLGANAQPEVRGEEDLPGKSNYFIGGDASKWQKNVANYARVRYSHVYPGIDMVYYGNQQQLEYDFILAPQADPQTIKFSFTGASAVWLDERGDLHLKLADGEMVQPAPFIYQEVNGERRQIAGSFVIKQNPRSKTRKKRSFTVGFEVGDYDRSLPLVIDPKLLFSTYVGGNTEFIDIVEGKGDFANGIALDNSGNVYITGNTDSTDFPASSGAYQTELELRGDDACLIGGPLPCGDAYVLKLNSTGTQILYATYLGGHNSDEGRAIAVDGGGRAYITGGTDPFNAGNFCINPYLWPTTSNAYQNKPCYGARGDSDAFLAVLSADGSTLVYSTYFGGGNVIAPNNDNIEIGHAIAIDSSGNAYIVGETTSNDLPEKNGFQPDRASSDDGKDAFIAKFDPDASSDNATFLYASFLGGTGDDTARGVSVDSVGNAYVVGETASTNLAVKAPTGQPLPPLQSSYNGGATDGFIAKVDATNATGGNSLVYLTYYGGAGRDVANAVAVEPATQRAHITGRSDSASGFPFLNAFDTSATLNEVFVAKLNADGTAQFYSTFLGSSSQDEGRGIALDAANNVYVTGSTLSSGFPKVNAFQNTLNSSDGDAFITKLSAVATPAQPKILYSSLLGGAGGGGAGKDIANGVAVDRKGNVYIAGQTASTSFPTTAGVVKTSSPNVSQFNLDAFVTKIESTFADTIGVYRPSTNQFLLRNSNTTGPQNITISLGQAGDQPITGDWDGNGTDDVGVFRPSTGEFFIRASATRTNVVNFGINNNDIAVAGDWDGDGRDSVGIFNRGRWLLTNSVNTGNAPINFSFIFGDAHAVPLAGDWDGDGDDSIGVLDLGINQFQLRNTNDAGSPDITFGFGGFPGDLIVTGDWDGDGKDTIGIFRGGQVFLTNNNIASDIIFDFGQNKDIPLGGDWDALPPPAQ